MKSVQFVCTLGLLALLQATMLADETVWTRATERKAVRIGGGGNGTSYAQAIIVHSPDWTSGVEAEYNWVISHFRGSKDPSFSREYYTKATYDVISFTTADGKRRRLYFNYRQHH